MSDDIQEVLRLERLVFKAVDEGDAATLSHYMTDDFLLTYSLYEQDKHGFMDKAQIMAKWGAKDANADADPTVISEARVHLSGDTAVVFALVTDTFREDNVEHVVRTWISDVWVKRNHEWRWFASHESFLK